MSYVVKLVLLCRCTDVVTELPAKKEEEESARSL